MPQTLASVDGTYTNPTEYDAGEVRRADAALVSQAGISSGLVVTVDASDLVTVTRGQAIISGEDAATGTGVYRAGTAGNVSGGLTARDATNGRIDLVVFRQYDTDVVGSHPRYKSEIEIIEGTPSATPSAPAKPSMSVELAKITVPASGGAAASVNNSGRVSARAIGAESPAWQSYTPTWTAGANPSLGNGSLVGSYVQLGKTVHYRIRLTAGSTTTYGSGGYLFSLPVTPRYTDAFEPMGQGVLQDVSASARLSRHAYLSGSTNVALHDGSGNVVTNAVPFTFASGDVISIRGTYEAA